MADRKMADRKMGDVIFCLPFFCLPFFCLPFLYIYNSPRRNARTFFKSSQASRFLSGERSR